MMREVSHVWTNKVNLFVQAYPISRYFYFDCSTIFTDKTTWESTVLYLTTLPTLPIEFLL